MTRPHWRCLVLALLLAGCQQPVAVMSADALADMGDTCTETGTRPCRPADQAAHPSSMPDERPTAESHARQVQRDVAAIIRGMRQTSASNGL